MLSSKQDGKPKMLPLKNVPLVPVERMQEKGKTRVAQTECCVMIY